MTLYRFPTRRRNFTSGFGFGDVIHLRRSKSICILNFGAFNPRLNYYHFQFQKQTTAIFDFFPVSILAILSPAACEFYIDLPNFILIGQSKTKLWRHICFQDGGYGIAVLFPLWPIVVEFRSASSEISWQKKKKERRKKESRQNISPPAYYVGRPNNSNNNNNI